MLLQSWKLQDGAAALGILGDRGQIYVYIVIIITSQPCLAACRRCITGEQKEEPGPRRFADFCAPTVLADAAVLLLRSSAYALRL